MTVVRNPYWDAVKDLLYDPARSYDATLQQRWPFCQRYCWAVPDPETLQFVSSWLMPRAIEIGAGTGYWAWLLTQLGVDMAAYDIDPPHLSPTNAYHSPRDTRTGMFLHQVIEAYFPVEPGGSEVLVLPRYQEHNLFLCWPPNCDDMAIECLDMYAGNRLVYIGSPRGGYCATHSFFDVLSQGWREVARHTPARWQDIYDEVVVYERVD
jgi:hypothetical protein